MTEFTGDYPFPVPLIFDTHAHYDDEKFSGISEKELFGKLSENGVKGIITCGCDGESSKAALKLSERNGFVYSAVGIHPCNIDGKTKIEQIRKLAVHKKCVAIGEIGLDYYWEPERKEIQKEYFTKQIILANELGLPVIVHDRDAHADTLEILKEYRPKGVVHSFSGSEEMAKEILKIGMYIGIGGVVTFKNSKKLPDIVKNLPIERILLETDSPYLAPEPMRGKVNNSSYIYYVAKKIAELRGNSTENILNIACENTARLFGI